MTLTFYLQRMKTLYTSLGLKHQTCCSDHHNHSMSNLIWDSQSWFITWLGLLTFLSTLYSASLFERGPWINIKYKLVFLKMNLHACAQIVLLSPVHHCASYVTIECWCNISQNCITYLWQTLHWNHLVLYDILLFWSVCFFGEVWIVCSHIDCRTLWIQDHKYPECGEINKNL